MSARTDRPLAWRLAETVAARESQIVLGIDPDPAALWPQAVAGAASDGPPAERAARAVTAHCRALIDAAAPACVAAKLQLACFERLGPAGVAALYDVAAYVRDSGLLLIADGKRGDIGISAAAYGQALFGGTPTPFGPVQGLGADFATVNPLLGRDALAPLVDAARAAQAGLFVLVRTSNPGAADVQDLKLTGGAPLWERLADLVDELGADEHGQREFVDELGAGAEASGHGPGGGVDGRGAGAEASGHGPGGGVDGRGAGAAGSGQRLSDVGAVVGATEPGHLQRARELMPRAVFLLPGVGAQGGRVEDLAAAFAPGRAGGLVSASRAIVGAYAAAGRGDPAAAARAAAERLREQAWSLSP